jgi:dihydroflavonol-4-reductase
MHAVHLDGTRNVVAAAGPDVRIVHTSSVVAVGAGRDAAPLDEEAPFNLRDLRVAYVHAKRGAEEIALAATHHGRDVVVVNPGYLLGPEDYEGSVMGRICLRTWKGRMLMAPPGGLNFVDVRDVALGHLLAAQHGRRGRRYILGNENLTVVEFMRRLAAVADLRPRWLPRAPYWFVNLCAGLGEARGWWTRREPYPSLQQTRMNGFYWHYRSDRARRELGYAPRPLEETLRDAYRWHFEQNPWTLRRLNRWWMRPATGAA